MLLTLDRLEVGHRRTVQDPAASIKARAMAGTVPRLFRAIPVHDALKCGQTAETHERPLFVTIDRDLSEAAANRAPSPFCSSNRASLLVNIDVLRATFIFLSRNQQSRMVDPGRIVEFRPGVIASPDQFGNEHSRDRAVGHPVARNRRSQCRHCRRPTGLRPMKPRPSTGSITCPDHWKTTSPAFGQRARAQSSRR